MGKVFVYGQIGREVRASEIVKAIAQDKEPLEVYINSPGGNVYEGMAIFNAIGRHGNASTFIDGLAYSAASWVALAAPKGKRFMARNAQFGIHQASNFGGGNKDELQAQIEVLTRIDKAQIELYHNATGLNTDEIQDIMKRETPLSFDESKEFGFVSGEHIPEKIAALFSTDKIDMNDVLKTFATFLKGDGEAPTNIKEEVLKETAEALEKAESTKQQMFTEFASNQAFMEHKKVVEAYTEASMKVLEGLPTKEEIVALVNAKATEKVVALFAEIKTKGHIPAPEETHFADTAKEEASYEPLNLGNKNFYDLIKK